MSQALILRHAYESLCQKLSEIGSNLQLFSVENESIKGGMDLQKGSLKSAVYLGISDISQLSVDKNGQKIIIDEASFEQPARIGLMVSITTVSSRYPDLLETVGEIIRNFKDDNIISSGEYNWHGNTGGKIFIEPVIREPKVKYDRITQELLSLTMEYRIEVAINSEKGTPVRRVEKQEIKSNIRAI
jgi:hypothetical protein